MTFTVSNVTAATRPKTLRRDIDMNSQLRAAAQRARLGIFEANKTTFMETIAPASAHRVFIHQLASEAHRYLQQQHEQKKAAMTPEGQQLLEQLGFDRDHSMRVMAALKVSLEAMRLRCAEGGEDDGYASALGHLASCRFFRGDFEGSACQL